LKITLDIEPAKVVLCLNGGSGSELLYSTWYRHYLFIPLPFPPVSTSASRCAWYARIAFFSGWHT